MILNVKQMNDYYDCSLHLNNVTWRYIQLPFLASEKPFQIQLEHAAVKQRNQFQAHFHRSYDFNVESLHTDRSNR